jgi:hypothetical protein
LVFLQFVKDAVDGTARRAKLVLIGVARCCSRQERIAEGIHSVARQFAPDKLFFGTLRPPCSGPHSTERDRDIGDSCVLDPEGCGDGDYRERKGRTVAQLQVTGFVRRVRKGKKDGLDEFAGLQPRLVLRGGAWRIDPLRRLT